MILTKPYTDEQYADFACSANKNCQRVEFLEDSVFALYPYEEVINGQIVDISETPEYKQKVLAEQNLIKKAKLQMQIDLLDSKRIRAIAEPKLKDSESGQTWLEYYTQQIQGLRAQIGIQ